MSTQEYAQFNVISVDAWRDSEGGWTWNGSIQVEAGVVFRLDRLTPRIIARKLREWGYLNNYSKGRVFIDMSCDECIEIQEKGTCRPIYALSQLHGDPISDSLRM